MTHALVSVLFTILLAGGLFADMPQSSPQALPSAQGVTNAKVARLQKRIGKIKIGTAITVKLRNRKRLKGHLISVSTDGFTLQTLEGSRITEKTISFDLVQKLSDEATSSQKKQTAWLIGGTALGSGILTVIILAGIGAL